MGGDPETQKRILITFDDGRADFYINALSALVNAGLKATLYIPPALLDTAGYITSAQAQEIYAVGMDIGVHGNTHVPLDGLSQSQQQTELTDAKNTLDALGITRSSSHAAYPFGAYNAATLAAMTAAGMATGRTATRKNFTMSDVHGTANGLFLLPVYYVRYGESSYTVPGTRDAVKNAISAAKNENQSLILVFHSIVDSDPVDQNDFLKADFVDVLQHIKDIGFQNASISEWHTLYQSVYP